MCNRLMFNALNPSPITTHCIYRAKKNKSLCYDKTTYYDYLYVICSFDYSAAGVDVGIIGV